MELQYVCGSSVAIATVMNFAFSDDDTPLGHGWSQHAIDNVENARNLGTHKTYNFTVDKHHTYIAGGFRVHNNSSAIERALEDVDAYNNGSEDGPDAQIVSINADPSGNSHVIVELPNGERLHYFSNVLGSVVFTENPETGVPEYDRARNQTQDSLAADQIGTFFGSILSANLNIDNAVLDVFTRSVLPPVFGEVLQIGFLGSGLLFAEHESADFADVIAGEFSASEVGVEALVNAFFFTLFDEVADFEVGSAEDVIVDVVVSPIARTLVSNLLQRQLLVADEHLADYPNIISDIADLISGAQGLDNVLNSVGSLGGAVLSAALSYVFPSPAENAETQAGAIGGSAVFGAVSLGLTLLASSKSAVAALGISTATSISSLAVAPFTFGIATAISGIFTSVLDDIFGKSPRATIETEFDPLTGTFVIVDEWSKDGGSIEFAREVANIYLDAVNEVVEASGGRVTSEHDRGLGHIEEAAATEYDKWEITVSGSSSGENGRDAIYKKTFRTAEEVAAYAVLSEVLDLEIQGGDSYIAEILAFYRSHIDLEAPETINTELAHLIAIPETRVSGEDAPLEGNKTLDEVLGPLAHGEGAAGSAFRKVANRLSVAPDTLYRLETISGSGDYEYKAAVATRTWQEFVVQATGTSQSTISQISFNLMRDIEAAVFFAEYEGDPEKFNTIFAYLNEEVDRLVGEMASTPDAVRPSRLAYTDDAGASFYFVRDTEAELDAVEAEFQNYNGQLLYYMDLIARAYRHGLHEIEHAFEDPVDIPVEPQKRAYDYTMLDDVALVPPDVPLEDPDNPGQTLAPQNTTLRIWETYAFDESVIETVFVRDPGGGGDVGFDLADDAAFVSPPPTPLVLDLDGDGIELTALSGSTTYFDLNLDGFAERTGWVHSDDALLALDRNFNGFIDDKSELFGNNAGFADGFADLAALDSNIDGVIDANDTLYHELLIWNDNNADGISAPSELRDLPGAGISSINLNAYTVSNVIAGNTVILASSFANQDGQVGQIFDVLFDTDLRSTKKLLNGSYNTDLKALITPLLFGMGDVSSTLVAMSEDNALLLRAEDLLQHAANGDVVAFMNVFENFVFDWAGTSDIEPGSRGGHVDARRLATLEAFYGSDFSQLHKPSGTDRSDPNAAAGELLEHQFSDLLEQLGARFLAQSAMSSRLRAELATVEAPEFTSPLQALSRLAETMTPEARALTGDVPAAIVELVTLHGAGLLDRDDTVLVIKLLRHDFSESLDAYVTMVSTVLAAHPDQVAANAVLANLTFDEAVNLPGTTGDDLLDGDGGRNILQGDLGNDTLKGRDGSDLYVFVRGDGQDTIHDDGFADTDELLIYGYLPSDLTLRPVSPGSADFIIDFAGANDTITVIGGYSHAHWNRLEAITFEDGTIWNTDEIQNRVTAGQSTDGDDYIIGSTASETLAGGLGNDTLSGDEDSDTYLFARGDGQDVINDNGYYDHDRLVLSGYAPSEVLLRPVSSGSTTLLLTFAGSSDQITIEGGLSLPYDTIEEFTFDDSTVWDFDTIRNKATAGQATDGDDLVTGANAADTLSGGLGNDTLKGLDGSDTYRFYRGGGHDTIHDDGWADTDRLEIIGYTASEAIITPDATDDQHVTISFTTSTDTIRLKHAFTNSGYNQIETFRFDDTGTLSIHQFRQLSVDSQVTDENDVVIGNISGTRIEGGLGNDTLSGGDGDDTYVYTLGDGSDIIDDDDNGSGFDTLELHGFELEDIYFDSYNPDYGSISIRFHTDPGSIRVYSALAGSSVQRILLDDGSAISLSDMRAAFGPSGTHFGTVRSENQDRIADLGFAFAGNDELKGAGGSDTLYGGAGNDKLWAEWNGTRTETVPNVLYGGPGSDRLYGAGGADTLDGGTGDDHLYGEGGDDTFIIAELGVERIYGGGGRDTVDFSGTTGYVYLNMAGSSIQFSGFSNGYITQVENAIGNESGNNIWGNNSSNIFYGHGGNDNLWGGLGGSDTLYGGDGNDQIEAQWGDDTYSKTTSNQLFGEAGDDRINGAQGNDVLDGGTGNDILRGRGGNDTLLGGAGDDQLTGGSGADRFVFEDASGADTITDFQNFSDLIDLSATTLAFADLTISADGVDALIDLTGGNTVRATAANGLIDQSDFIFRSVGIVLNGGSGGDTFLGTQFQDTLDGGGGNDSVDGGSGEDSIFGGEGHDTLKGGNQADTLYGDNGDDTLFAQVDGTRTETVANTLDGGSGNDQLYGAAGQDTIYGGIGNDYADGWGGDDSIFGGDGHDTLKGGNQSDTLYGEGGNDTLFAQVDGTRTETVANTLDGGAGSDQLYGAAGEDSLLGGAGNDSAEGASGNDAIFGGDGNDTLKGGNDSDVLYGEDGDDTLYAQVQGTRTETAANTLDGGAGNDELIGAAGADILDGGHGNDTLTGEAGADVFVFGGASGADTITDFENGTDLIDLSTSALTFGALTISTDGADAIIDLTNGNSIRLNGAANQVDETDFIFA
ncbi:MAG: calcium-binding protein [Pseudomonadota bacterium]